MHMGFGLLVDRILYRVTGRRIRMRRVRLSFWVCMACLSLAAIAANPAEAQEVAPGVQAGVSLDPDQFYFGGHIETSPLVDRLRFRPSVDVGIGDGVTLVAGNFEFTYTFPGSRPWNLYVGGGPAINWYSVDDGGSDSEGGFNFLIGAKNNAGLFFEMKIGVEGSPDLKFGVGYTFR
jgi:hypothetical protein